MSRTHRQIPVAIFVDVDGTLASRYRQGRRELRPSAREALAMLAEAAPVFLWSTVGAENGERLLEEFPELRRYLKGCYGKGDFPLDRVDRAYAIDDEARDDPVLACHRVGLCETYQGGDGQDDFLRIASLVVAEIRSDQAGAIDAMTSSEFGWADGWLFFALIPALENDAFDLRGVIAAADGMNHAIPMVDELNAAMNRFVAAGLLSGIGGLPRPTDAARALLAEAYTWAGSIHELFRPLADELNRRFPPGPVNHRVYFDDAAVKAAYEEYAGRPRGA